MKLSANDIVLKLLGLLLLTAAVFKSYELLTEPVASTDIWSNRYFLIFTVEFELALGIWLLSGLFKKLAWLTATVCFTLFCCITLYKAALGYGSCGCFGKVQINPWITLFAIDIPAIALLLKFRPNEFSLKTIISPLELFRPLPKLQYLFGVSVTVLVAMAMSIPLLASNDQAIISNDYQVLEPESWIGKKIPILEYIDVADQLEVGKYIILFYRDGCMKCQGGPKKLVELKKNGNMKEKTVILKVPPFKNSKLDSWSKEIDLFGTLSDSKKWFIKTPTLITLSDGIVRSVDGNETITPRKGTKLISLSKNNIQLGKTDPLCVNKGSLFIKNISKKKIKLNVKSFCGCAKPFITKHSLLPAQSTKLYVTFYPEKRNALPGEFIQEPIFVIADDGNLNEKQTVIVDTTIEEQYKLEPFVLDFRNIKDEDMLTKHVKLTFLHEQLPKLNEIHFKVTKNKKDISVSNISQDLKSKSVFFDVSILADTISKSFLDVLLITWKDFSGKKKLLTLKIIVHSDISQVGFLKGGDNMEN